MQLTGSEGSAADPKAVRLRAPAPSPTSTTTLADTTGLHSGLVTPKPGACNGEPTRQAFPQGPDEWCLQLIDVAPGHELTGTVTSGDLAEVALTVRRRDSFLFGPLLTIIAGLLVGIIATCFPAQLRPAVRERVLARLLEANRARDPSERIHGLNDWVYDRHRHGEDIDKLISEVKWMTENGVALAHAARVSLRKTLEAHPDLAGHAPKLWHAAKVTVDRRTATIEELRKDDGNRRDTPLADTWSAAVDRAAKVVMELDERAKAIAALPDGSGKHKAEEALRIARSRVTELEDTDDVERLGDVLDALQDAVAAAQPLGLVPFAAGAEQGERSAPRGPLAVTGSHANPLAPLSPRAWPGPTLVAATVLIALIALAYALVTIKTSTYDSKPLFHSASDYVATFSAALVSGAAGTVLTVLGWWRASGKFADG